jgi:hypothetical protein
MKTLQPHELFHSAFDYILEEGKRQEEIHQANKGEYSIVQNMHTYFETEVIPLIIQNDWVYEAALKFAKEYALECFHYLQLGGQEVLNAQRRLIKTNENVTDFLAHAHLIGVAPLALTTDLVKASDFLSLLKIDKLSKKMKEDAQRLHEEAKDQEALQLNVTLRAIRDNYEITLPRVMYVVRRAIKIKLGQPAKSSDNELTGISQNIDWYTSRITASYSLEPVFGNLHQFYKVARNVGSHHNREKWDPENNEITLDDNAKILKISVYEFQQRYRHLAHLCELGLRGILSDFCERERGKLSNNLVMEYLKIFSKDFPNTEEVHIQFYPDITSNTPS